MHRSREVFGKVFKNLSKARSTALREVCGRGKKKEVLALLSSWKEKTSSKNFKKALEDLFLLLEEREESRTRPLKWD